MRPFALALCLLLSAQLPALQPSKAPADMDSVRHAWTLLGWEDAKQARQWFKTASRSDDALTAYYGLEGIADSDSMLNVEPMSVLREFDRAKAHVDRKVLDEGVHKRLRDRIEAYQAKVVERCAPGAHWQGQDGRRALQAIGEGRFGASRGLRLKAFEALGDRAVHAGGSRNAYEAAAAAWRMALNQDPEPVDRTRLEAKIRGAEAHLPGHKAEDDASAYDQAGLVADPALLALMGRCSQCGGQGGKQRRACAEVAQTYTQFYGPGARRPPEAKVRTRVKALQVKLTDSGCF